MIQTHFNKPCVVQVLNLVKHPEHSFNFLYIFHPKVLNYHGVYILPATTRRSLTPVKFYSEAILSRRGPLAKVWLAAHMERKLSKTQTLQTDIEQAAGASSSIRDFDASSDALPSFQMPSWDRRSKLWHCVLADSYCSEWFESTVAKRNIYWMIVTRLFSRLKW